MLASHQPRDRLSRRREAWRTWEKVGRGGGRGEGPPVVAVTAAFLEVRAEVNRSRLLGTASVPRERGGGEDVAGGGREEGEEEGEPPAPRARLRGWTSSKIKERVVSVTGGRPGGWRKVLVVWTV